MKRVFFLIFFVSLFFLTYKIIDIVLIKIKKKDSLAEIPNFTFETMEGDLFELKDMKQNNWTVFLFFGTGCHFCKEEAKELKLLLTEIQNIHFYWISDEPKNLIKKFERFYGLAFSDNITFLHDKGSMERIKWGISATPQFLIYRPDGTLFKNHKGALRMDTLISQIHDTQTP